jgi:hypothetical protein
MEQAIIQVKLLAFLPLLALLVVPPILGFIYWLLMRD